MTVAELIKALEAMPQDMEVITVMDRDDGTIAPAEIERIEITTCQAEGFVGRLLGGRAPSGEVVVID